MRVVGHCEHCLGDPVLDGLYTVEVFHGWKLLEWHSGEWWHQAKVGRWMADNPVQWVGPLPLRMKDREKVFDL